MKTVYIAWQDAGPQRKWVPIGRLDADTRRGHYVFRYTRGAEQAQAAGGFSPLDAFPVLREVYAAAELFPFFANRLVDSTRPSFKRYLERLDFEAEAPDPIEVLSLTEGRRATDNFEVFPRVDRAADGRFDIKFFVHGWRHVHPIAPKRMETLRSGERLNVSFDATNPATGYAIQILSEDYVMLGWSPRYLVTDLIQVMFQGDCGVAAQVVRVNPPPAPPGQRLLVRFSGCWPAGFQPMSDPVFEPLLEMPLKTPVR
jgi:hypothetical protein